MIIYKDRLTGDELFSDAYKPKLSEDGSMWVFESKMTQRKEGDIDERLIGGNASAEEAGEDCEADIKSGFEFVLDNGLVEKEFAGKKDFAAYLKAYFTALKEVALKDKPEQEDELKARFQGFCNPFAKKIGDLSFYIGQSQDEHSLPLFVEWNDDGVSGKIYCFRDGVIEEKF